MKPLPADSIAHALAATWGFVVVSSQAIFLFGADTLHRAQAAASPPISDETAIMIAFVFGVMGAGIAALASKGGVKERVATGLASLGFGVGGGPLSAQLLIAAFDIHNGASFQIIMGTSFMLAIAGWPVYKFMLALFVAADHNASGLGRFFGEFVKVFLRRKDGD
jgi:hypothetical protein